MTVVLRPYSVRTRHWPAGHGRLIEETSFEAAALAFVDHHAPGPDEADLVELRVLDLDSGAERCFRLDLSTGDVRACE